MSLNKIASPKIFRIRTDHRRRRGRSPPQGVKSLICSRPDGEANDQPTVTEIKRRGGLPHGLPWCTCRSSPAAFSDADVADFAAAHRATMSGRPTPTVARARAPSRSGACISAPRPGRRKTFSSAPAPWLRSECCLRTQPPGAPRTAPAKLRDHYDILIVGAGAAGFPSRPALCRAPRPSPLRSSILRKCTTTSRAGPWSAAVSSAGGHGQDHGLADSGRRPLDQGGSG
jgi:hypothetical protein